MTIALFGGSFDPPHIGHLSVAREVLENFGADRFYFMPAAHSPLKINTPMASDEDRLAMLGLIALEVKGVAVTDCELRRRGVSYTVDTLRQWREDNPGARLLFIAGMDSLLTLHSWKSPLEIVSMCDFITFCRPGYGTMPSAADLKLPADVAEKLLAQVFIGKPVDASSTEIRRLAAECGDFGELTTPRVAEYIRAHRLYCKQETVDNGRLT